MSCFGTFTGNVGYTFGIDPELGIISLARSLDMDVRTEYELTIMANDMGVPRLSSTTLVKVCTRVSVYQWCYKPTILEVYISDSMIYAQRIFKQCDMLVMHFSYLLVTESRKQHSIFFIIDTYTYSTTPYLLSRNIFFFTE